MTEEYKEDIREILDELGQQLDISETEFKAAVRSYEAVGNWLSRETSPLHRYSPRILPQGSFMLGTMIKPINEDDDLDIDLVCKLQGKPVTWTQKSLKDAVGDRLKDNDTYRDMIEDEDGGRRCWTLEYADQSNYHMDILPSFADDNFPIYLRESFNNSQQLDVDRMAIRITDKEEDNYATETNSDEWMKSNPFGYAKWFFQKAIILSTKMFSLNESVDPVREYEKEKLPLQRVVQLLKRHRDIMFSDDKYDIENKPISIIITTLSSRAYDKSENIIDAYTNVVRRMKDYIEVRFNEDTGKYEKWVSNPVNPEENFADKWVETPQKEEYFFEWLNKLEEDLDIIRNSGGVGLQNLSESFAKIYGKSSTNKAFASYGERKRIMRESGKQKMASLTGALGASGTTIPNHNFEGVNGE